MLTSTRIVNINHEFFCKSYTLKHKRMTVCPVLEIIATGSNVSSACSLVMAKCNQFYRWTRAMQGEKDAPPKKAKTSQAISVDVMTSPVDEIPNFSNTISLSSAVLTQKLLGGNLQSLNLDKLSILAKEVKLLPFIFEQCKQGKQVTTRMVKKFAKKKFPE